MKFSLIALTMAVGSLVSALPTATDAGAVSGTLSAVKRASSGSYTVSGLGTRKKALTSSGGNSLDMAVAMLETDNMQANYQYGDGKSGDSFNAGIFKQNWGMLRVCASQFKGQSTSQYNNAAVLNSNLGQDVTAIHQCQSYYGQQKWFAGHRNGASGLSNPNTADINSYINAVKWIQSQINSNSKYKTDDTRFWVNVPPI